MGDIIAPAAKCKYCVEVISPNAAKVGYACHHPEAGSLSSKYIS